jgi:hypothetical protein
MKSLTLVGLGLLVPALAARATRSLAGRGYHAITQNEPPRNPADPEVEWRDAIIWTVVSGIVGGLARLVARRLLAESQVPAEGHGFELKDQARGLA